MKFVITFLIGVLVGGIAASFVGISQQVDPSIQQTSGAVAYNCSLSGGTFKNGECACPLEMDQTQEQMYDEETGFCQTTFGGPGGAAFAASMGLPHGYYSYYQDIVYSLCQESGGSISGAACICPDPTTYDKTNGYCMDPFGIPGGEPGEVAKKLQELKMLKND